MGMRQRWPTSSFGVTCQPRVHNCLCSLVESITLTERIIPFPSWHWAQSLFIVHLPCSPLNDGLSAAPLWRKKRKLRRETEGRYGTKQLCSHQSTSLGQKRTERQPRSGALMKTQNHRAHSLLLREAGEPTSSPLALESSPADVAPRAC